MLMQASFTRNRKIKYEILKHEPFKYKFPKNKMNFHCFYSDENVSKFLLSTKNIENAFLCSSKALQGYSNKASILVIDRKRGGTMPSNNIPELTVNNLEPDTEPKPRRRPPLQRGISRNKSDPKILPVSK